MSRSRKSTKTDLTKYKNFKEAVLKNNGKLNLPLFMKPAKTAPPVQLMNKTPKTGSKVRSRMRNSNLQIFGANESFRTAKGSKFSPKVARHRKKHVVLSPQPSDLERKMDMFFGPYNNSIVAQDQLEYSDSDSSQEITPTPVHERRQSNPNWQALQKFIFQADKEHFHENCQIIHKGMHHSELPAFKKIKAKKKKRHLGKFSLHPKRATLHSNGISKSKQGLPPPNVAHKTPSDKTSQETESSGLNLRLSSFGNKEPEKIERIEKKHKHARHPHISFKMNLFDEALKPDSRNRRDKEPLTAGIPHQNQSFAMKTYYGMKNNLQLKPIKKSEEFGSKVSKKVKKGLYFERRNMHRSLDLGDQRSSTQAGGFFPSPTKENNPGLRRLKTKYSERKKSLDDRQNPETHQSKIKSLLLKTTFYKPKFVPTKKILDHSYVKSLS